MRHAQMRNVIERIFRVLKREFKMAREPCEYKINIQCRIPLGLALVHNFLRTHDPTRHSDQLHIPLRHEPVHNIHGDIEPAAQVPIAASEDAAASARRDRIASELWAQYQNELEARRQRE